MIQKYNYVRSLIYYIRNFAPVSLADKYLGIYRERAARVELVRVQVRKI